MADEKKIKKSFMKVKEDMLQLSDEIHEINSGIKKNQENTQEWIISILRREDDLHRRISIVEDRLQKIENLLKKTLYN